MNNNTRIQAFVSLGRWMQQELVLNKALLQNAHYHNRFFTVENILLSIQSIAENYLNEKKLLHWLSNYTIKEPQHARRIGLVMAGNIPLVGFHDLLCVLISGHKAVIKLSSKDKLLLPEITAQLIKIEPRFDNQIIYADLLKQIDAVIATGGNNTSRYFEYYFGKYPNIIRKNKNSVALLTGNESDDDLKKLGNDVFQYFGLGCRNVSFLLIPEKYDFTRLIDAWQSYACLMEEDIYKNNFDYQYTLSVMNKIPHISAGFVVLRESHVLASPVACLHYKTYKHIQEALDFIVQNQQFIQCVVASGVIANSIPFGKSQQPELWDYADGTDTLQFLQRLN
jgi:hypothetical protein